MNVEERLARIEARLAQIETYFQPITVQSKPKPKPTPASQPLAPPAPREKSGNWLALAAVICFVLAAGFIIKLSIESGWLTPARQIGLAALLGFSLIGTGLTLMRQDREYASFLPGAGVIVLYLAAFAAHRYYNLITFEVALAAMSCISGLCIWLYTQMKDDLYAITAAAGAYVAPIVLGFNAGAEFTLWYFLLCSVAFSAISTWVESRTLTFISAYLAILMTGLIGIELYADRLVATILALHFAVFTVGTYLYSRQNRTPLTEEQGWCFLPVLLTFYALEYFFINRIDPGLAPWMSLGFAFFLLALWVLARRLFPESPGSRLLVLAFTTVVGFHSVYLELLPDDFRPWLFALIMFVAAFLPSRAQTAAWRIPLLGICAILIIEYVEVLFYLFADKENALPVAAAAFAGLWAVIIHKEGRLTGTENQGHTLLAAAHLIAVPALYRLAYDIGSLAVSASWLFYAVCVMLYAFRRRDEIMAKSALVVLAFAAGKALLYDAANAPTLVRILCLLLTGAVLYGCGMLMRKIARWKPA